MGGIFSHRSTITVSPSLNTPSWKVKARVREKAARVLQREGGWAGGGEKPRPGASCVLGLGFSVSCAYTQARLPSPPESRARGRMLLHAARVMPSSRPETRSQWKHASHDFACFVRPLSSSPSFLFFPPFVHLHFWLHAG